MSKNFLIVISQYRVRGIRLINGVEEEFGYSNEYVEVTDNGEYGYFLGTQTTYRNVRITVRQLPQDRL